MLCLGIGYLQSEIKIIIIGYNLSLNIYSVWLQFITDIGLLQTKCNQINVNSDKLAVFARILVWFSSKRGFMKALVESRDTVNQWMERFGVRFGVYT